MNILALLEKIIARFSLVGDRAFFDLKTFPWVREVERDYPSIRSEMEWVLSRRFIPNFQDISPDQAAITSDDGWKTFFFYAYGERAEGNCTLCPGTERALLKIPGMVTAFYSVLESGKHIPPHRGPYKGVLRYHLALQVPDPEHAGISIDGCFVRWHEGESLVFDDTYEHQAWNFGHGKRVVLFVDFLRPLPFPLNLVNKAIVRYIRSTEFVQAGVRRLRDIG